MTHPLAKALASGAAADWSAYRDYSREKLTPEQRFLMAYSTFQACTEADQQELLAMMAWKGNDPVPPLAGCMDAAREWASLAQADELKAYAGACWERMAERHRRDFLDWMSRGQAA